MASGCLFYTIMNIKLKCSILKYPVKEFMWCWFCLRPPINYAHQIHSNWHCECCWTCILTNGLTDCLTAWMSHCQHSDQIWKRTNIINHQAIRITKNIYTNCLRWMDGCIRLCILVVTHCIRLISSFHYSTQYNMAPSFI